jgi:ribosomal-protein-alanine N-acetyltransferase
MACTSLSTPVLHTARLRLRPFTEEDANALFALHRNVRVLRYWDYRPGANLRAPSASSRPAARCPTRAQGCGSRWIACQTASSSVGAACPAGTRTTAARRCASASMMRRGVMATRPRPRAPWSSGRFDTLALNRVQAETDTRNLASAQVLENLGFVREGMLREDCVVKRGLGLLGVRADQAGLADEDESRHADLRVRSLVCLVA